MVRSSASFGEDGSMAAGALPSGYGSPPAAWRGALPRRPPGRRAAAGSPAMTHATASLLRQVEGLDGSPVRRRGVGLGADLDDEVGKGAVDRVAVRVGRARLGLPVDQVNLDRVPPRGEGDRLGRVEV